MKNDKTPILNRRRALKLGINAISTFALGGILSSCGIERRMNYHQGTSSVEGTTNPLIEGTWASGGTDLITVNYPDDSIFLASSACQVSVKDNTTLGPCYFSDSTGEDISTGLSGLPMQLCLRLVDSNCNPLSGYKIEVWHCDNRGIYSGDTSNSSDASSFAGNFCTANDSAAANSTWYRGVLTSNTSGRVNFKTHFPGWYRGRTIHIHFAILDANNNRKLISQLCYSDSFAKQVCTTHPYYADRGEPDTTLSGGTDTVFPSNGYENFQMSVKQNIDGTLLAYHTIMLI